MSGHSIIRRDLKIDEDIKNRDYREVDEFLKTVSKKFMNEPVSLENLDKVYNDMLKKPQNSLEGEKTSKIME